MALPDSQVQVQPDSSGAKVETSRLTRDDSTVVERQRLVVGDPNNPLASGMAKVKDNLLQTEDRTTDVLEEINDSLKQIVFVLNGLMKQ